MTTTAPRTRPSRSIADAAPGHPAWQRQIPRATYRFQFKADFTFRDARALVGYLHDLGVSDVYASPYFRARAESTHGYDIANHNSLNPAIGSEADYAAFVAELRAHDLGQVLDFVPNHMGIGEPANEWWMDVLENGPASLYADFFDIDWRPLKPELRDKVLLPVLGDQYGVVLENGELKLTYEDGTFRIYYYQHLLPVAPRTMTRILERLVPRVAEALGPEHDSTLELQSIITGLSHLPPPVQTTRERKLERAREKEILKRRFATLCAGDPAVRAALDAVIEQFNGTPGDPASFDDLDALLDMQPYRLSFWRTASEEINYRRFFDINDLAAIRVENEAVFKASHRLLLRLLREGAVTGLRLDHPDGLWDPAGYFGRLQQAFLREQVAALLGGGNGASNPAEARGTAAAEIARELGSGDSALARLDQAVAERYQAALASEPHGETARPLYVLVEKILSGRERLPERWPVDGTTGYEFLNAVNGIFVERGHRRALDSIYDNFTHSHVEFRDLVYDQKRLVLRTALASELNVLAHRLEAITEQTRRYRNFTLNGLRTAIREVIACFPVYRTYITGPGTVDRHDRAAIDAAVQRAIRINPAMEPTIFEFLRNVLMMQQLDGSRGADPEAQLAFVMKFQQVTGPVMAKGLEDTAFYIYNRLVSLNDVGGEPDQFGITVTHFHRLNADRAERWPHNMLTTSTHDTKRSEDVRARINVLSEVPHLWSEALERWRLLNRPRKAILQEGVAPDRNEEYLLYQTLLGAWPLERMDADAYAAFRERIAAYMLKALREAKVNTSWINPNNDYDEAVQRFVHAILGDSPESPFPQALRPLQQIVARFGAYNSLGQTLIKLTAPGVPDIYQGTELWDLSLVDPDNRRPVDYRLRRRLLRGLLRQIEESGDDLAPLCRRLLGAWQDGRIKLYLTQRTLSYRREQPALFRDGSYLPLTTDGDLADHLVAYARRLEDDVALMIVPRLLVRVTPKNRQPLGEETWGDTVVILPPELTAREYRNVFTGARLTPCEHSEGTALAAADLFRDLPFALLGTATRTTRSGRRARQSTADTTD